MFYKYDNTRLVYEKVSTYTLIAKVLGGALVILALISTLQATTHLKLERITQEEKLIIIRENNQFSEEKLIKKVDELNFRFPHIILAQSMQETGEYTSKIFKENNNLFGMKQAYQRANLAAGTNRSHAYYDNWEDSVIDYALYYSTYLYKLKTEKEYYEYLRQNYAEDTEYVNRLKTIVQNNKLEKYFKRR